MDGRPRAARGGGSGSRRQRPGGRAQRHIGGVRRRGSPLEAVVPYGRMRKQPAKGQANYSREWLSGGQATPRGQDRSRRRASERARARGHRTCRKGVPRVRRDAEHERSPGNAKIGCEPAEHHDGVQRRHEHGRVLIERARRAMKLVCIRARRRGRPPPHLGPHGCQRSRGQRLSRGPPARARPSGHTGHDGPRGPHKGRQVEHVHGLAQKLPSSLAAKDPQRAVCQDRGVTCRSRGAHGRARRGGGGA